MKRKKLRGKSLRNWLKQLGSPYTDYNPHVALLRKRVTSLYGKAVIPPQLNHNEEQRVLVLFSKAIDEYDLLMEESMSKMTTFKKNNKPYYPYVLFKILCIAFKKDRRLSGLIECIHLQSDDTIQKKDDDWKILCKRLRAKGEKEFRYRPTDRSKIIRIY